MNFNSSITQCMVKTMEHLSDFDFVTITYVTLVRRGVYLAHFKSGIKQDTLTALCQTPLELATYFPDSILKKAEEDIFMYEDKGHAHSSSTHSRYHPYRMSDKPSQETNSSKPAFNGQFNKKKGRHQTSKYSSPTSQGSVVI